MVSQNNSEKPKVHNASSDSPPNYNGKNMVLEFFLQAFPCSLLLEA